MLKWSYTMIKWGLFQQCNNDSTSINQSVWHITLIEQRLRIIAVDAETKLALDKIQHQFMTKVVNKADSEETYLNIIKVV